MSELFDLRGKVAIVTGSTRGIGRAIASRFAEHGAQVDRLWTLHELARLPDLMADGAAA